MFTDAMHQHRTMLMNCVCVHGYKWIKKFLWHLIYVDVLDDNNGKFQKPRKNSQSRKIKIIKKNKMYRSWIKSAMHNLKPPKNLELKKLPELDKEPKQLIKRMNEILQPIGFNNKNDGKNYLKDLHPSEKGNWYKYVPLMFRLQQHSRIENENRQRRIAENKTKEMECSVDGEKICKAVCYYHQILKYFKFFLNLTLAEKELASITGDFGKYYI